MPSLSLSRLPLSVGVVCSMRQFYVAITLPYQVAFLMDYSNIGVPAHP